MAINTVNYGLDQSIPTLLPETVYAAVFFKFANLRPFSQWRPIFMFFYVHLNISLSRLVHVSAIQNNPLFLTRLERLYLDAHKRILKMSGLIWR